MRVACWTLLLSTFLLSATSLQAQYVGSSVCLGCHTGGYGSDKTSWLATFHHKAYADPDGSPGVIPHDDFVDSLDLSTDPDFASYDPAPVLWFDPTDPGDSTDLSSGYRVTIGNITYTVNRTHGGNGWKQRFHVKIGDSFYVLPIQYNMATDDWVTFHPEHWYDDLGNPLYTDPGTIEADIVKKNCTERRCDGCHVTGINLQWNAQGDSAYTATYVEMGIGCEMCHGDYDGGAGEGHQLVPEDIENTERANEVCGQCHNRGYSVAELGGNTLGFPWSDAGGFIPTDSLPAFFVYEDTLSSAFWPDHIHSKKHRQQFLDFYRSPKPTFAYHEVRCWECHDPHGSANKHDILEEIVEIEDTDTTVIATENDNNTLCLACHSTHGDFEGLTKEMIAEFEANIDTISAVVTAHTHHSWDPENNSQTGGASRCSKCHQPKIAKSAVNYDIHSHVFDPIPPEDTIDHEMPNACAVSCHRNPTNANVPDFGITDTDIGDWTEASDVALADTLMYWYGPGGLWWDTTPGGIEGDETGGSLLPKVFSLSQNYPNPFNPTTTVRFDVPKTSTVKLIIYDIHGRKVRTLVDRPLEAGQHTLTWNGRNEFGVRVASGVYFYRLTSEGFSQTKKMVVLK
ncbi:MAG: T9SS type A sorting domain-containing protein [Candidatus Glassbacteria bacterium]